MVQGNWDWEDLGRNIEHIVDRAVNSHDYRKLNQTIRQVVETAVDVGSEAVRKAVDASSRPAQHSATALKREVPAVYAPVGGKTAAGILKIVGGSLVLALFLAVTILGMVLLWRGRSLPLILGAAGMCGGGLLIGSGAAGLGRLGRFKSYRQVLGCNTHCSLEKLARSVGKTREYVRRDLKKMIAEGLFLEGHLDREGQSLITSHETYRYYENSRMQLEQRQKLREESRNAPVKEPKPEHPPQVQEVLDKGHAFIQQIRRCNDAIPGEEISAKIDRMEQIVRKIFRRAEAHPQIVPDLKKMMDYYLPMTVKLLNAYADMDAQSIQGQTIESSKREIEQTLDTLNLAFEKLLDELFQETALDVSSDISVLKTLLAQEGLTEDELTKMRKKNDP